jgi:hypothetical protein
MRKFPFKKKNPCNDSFLVQTTTIKGDRKLGSNVLGFHNLISHIFSPKKTFWRA